MGGPLAIVRRIEQNKLRHHARWRYIPNAIDAAAISRMLHINLQIVQIIDAVKSDIAVLLICFEIYVVSV